MAKPGAGAGARPKKRKVEHAEDDDALSQRLAAYGERFLSMFDDAEERQATAPAAEPADDSDSEEGGSSSDGGESGSGGSDGGDAPPADLVEHIFDGSGKRSRPSSASGSKPGSQRGAGPAGGAGGMPRTPQPPPLAASEAERLRLERKRFMSSKAAVITSGGPGSQPGSQRRRRPGGTPGSALGGEEDGVSREEFMAMQREVQQLGATALDKKSRKKFEAEQLARLGAKAEARPRMAASIGHGMAKKQAQRAERALQEGIAAGMVQLKGMGKRKRREKEKERKKERGLMEDGGAFKPGILRVKAPPVSGGGRGGGKGGKRR